MSKLKFWRRNRAQKEVKPLRRCTLKQGRVVLQFYTRDDFNPGDLATFDQVSGLLKPWQRPAEPIGIYIYTDPEDVLIFGQRWTLEKNQ